MIEKSNTRQKERKNTSEKLTSLYFCIDSVILRIRKVRKYVMTVLFGL